MILLLVPVQAALGDPDPGDPAPPTHRFQMDEIWEITESDQGEFLFGEIEDLLIDEHGTLFILDSQLANVKVFSAEGRYLRTIGREGDGPGEVRAPGSLAFMPDGSLGLVSKLDWGITRIDKVTGEPRGRVRILGDDGDVVLVHRAQGTGNKAAGRLVALARRGTGGLWNWEMVLGLYRPMEGEEETYPEKNLAVVGEASGADLEEEEFYAIWDPWTVDALGRIVMAPYWGRYLLRYFDGDGSLSQQVEFPWPPRPRTAQEKQLLLDKVWAGTSPEEFGVKLVTSANEAAVRRLHPMPDGSLWIRTGNSAYQVGPGVFRIYDVVAPDGVLVSRAEIHGKADDQVDKVYFGPGQLMVVVHGAERYVQNHRGLAKDAPEYDLVVRGYRLREFGND